MAVSHVGGLLFLALAWGGVLGGGLFVLLYLVPEIQSLTSEVAAISALIPYGMILWLVATVGFLAGARGPGKFLAAGTIAAFVLQVSWTRPYWPHTPPTVDAPTLRVMAANVHGGRAGPEAVAAAIRESDADVLVLLEATEAFVGSPTIAAALAHYPHRLGREGDSAAREGAAPTLVLARFPMEALAQVDSRFDQYVIRVSADPVPLTLVAAHPLNMLPGGHVWEHEGNILRRAITPHLSEPVAVVGDLNATPEHLTLRRLTDGLGLELGAQEAGAGWQPTYNAGIDWLPPMVAIDHVLTNDRVTATSFRTVPLPGSDHHAIVADLAID